MAKTIMVLLDGCTYKDAEENMGYLEHLCEKEQGAKYKVRGELPAMSRPLYETLLTGLPVYQHGIFNNLTNRMSNCENLFSLCDKNALVTGAAAYFWMSELYNRAPFDYVQDRIRLEKTSGIHHGIYYYEDCYPDSHVLGEGEFIRRTYQPDFLLIHTMNVDNEGHLHGGGSKNYNSMLIKADVLLSQYITMWRAQGYQVIVTADHGMNENGFHCGNTSADRTVPLYIFSDKIQNGIFTDKEITQLSIAPLVCYLLEISKGEHMIDVASSGVCFKC